MDPLWKRFAQLIGLFSDLVDIFACNYDIRVVGIKYKFSKFVNIGQVIYVNNE